MKVSIYFQYIFYHLLAVILYFSMLDISKARTHTEGYRTHLECLHPIVVSTVYRQENGLFGWRPTATKKQGRAIKRLLDSHQAEGSLREHLLPLRLVRKGR